MNLGDRVLMLNHGQVQQFDAPEALYHEPANGFVAGFLGAVPLGHGAIRKDADRTTFEIDGMRFGLGTSALPDATPADAVVMAERVTFTPVVERSRGDDEYEGTVTSLDFYGPFARAQARLGSLTVPAMMLSQHAHALEAGRRVWIRIVPCGLHAFAAQGATR